MKTIKLTMMALMMCFVFTSCSKEEEECNCGLITSDDVTDYSVTIRNDCSGNSKKFYLTEGDWMNAHPGNNYCISNVTSW
jgi:hypothetical protein